MKHLSHSSYNYPFIIRIGTLLFTLLLSIAFIGIDDNYFLLAPLFVLVVGFIISLIIPKTYKIFYGDSGIQIGLGSDSTFIPLDQIDEINQTSSFTNSVFKTRAFYCISLNSESKLGKTIYFYSSDIQETELKVSELRSFIFDYYRRK